MTSRCLIFKYEEIQLSISTWSSVDERVLIKSNLGLENNPNALLSHFGWVILKIDIFNS